jgi:low affinity Fe/Cu permease
MEPARLASRFEQMHASRTSQAFARIANAASRSAGRAVTFALALGIVAVWAVTGPLFGFSDTWQLVINTGTTIITFLMVFLIQNSQNRDGAAIQVKLDEIIRNSNVRNSFVGIEHLTEDELEELRTKCEQRAKEAREGDTPPRRRDLEKVKEDASRAAEKVSV